MGLSRFGQRHRTLRLLGTSLASALLIVTQLILPVAAAPVAPAAPAPQAAPAAPVPVVITLHAYAARTEPDADIGSVVQDQAVRDYKWMINLDNTGTTTQRDANPGSGCSTSDAGYPDSCLWTSIAGLKSSAPVVAQGETVGSADGTTTLSPDLDPGRYLVSVLAEGYKLDGTPFTVGPSGGPVTVDVPLQPLPLPTATIKAQVFADVTSANGQFDPGEDGLPGFAGKITDYIGQVNTDVFGNPLCTVYDFTDTNGDTVQDPGEPTILTNGEPTVFRQGGKCLTGDINMDGLYNSTDEGLYVTKGLDPTLARGVLTIPNLGPNRYALSMVPPTGSSWVQTTTLEGNHDWDAWVMEGATGLDTEFVVAGEPFPATIFGYVPGKTSTYQAAAGRITGANSGGTVLNDSNARFQTAGVTAGMTVKNLTDGSTGTVLTVNSQTRLTLVARLTGGTANSFAVGNAYVVGTYWDYAAHKFAAGGHGTIKGVVDAMKVFVPTTGGACLPGTVWGGLCGGKIDKPIDQPYVALSDLNRGDTAVWFGRGDGNGEFTIPNVPDGSYTLTYWDEAQNYILDLVQVTVANGETVDMGVLPLTGWFTKFEGHIFDDANRNGKQDAGELGVPNFTLTLRKRENSLMDRGATVVSTDQSGYYVMENAYPLTEWLVLEAYDDAFYTTGITYQADNQPTPTTVLGQGVDVSVLPIIGLSGTLDWGVHAYDATGEGGVDPQNGGIVGSISYDTTRNELDPQYAAAEDWQPGVSGITVELWSTVDCGTNVNVLCDARGDYELAPDGSYAKGKLLNTYVSETWERPTSGPDDGQLDCIARGVDGAPLANPADQQVLPIGPDKGCLEGPLMGVQFGAYATDQGNPAIANFGAAVDGNYGFGDACIDGTLDATDPAAPVCKNGTGAEIPFTTLGAADYLVHIDLGSQVDANGDPIYKVTREEDINIGNGDTFVPQIPPPACAGALHMVDVAGMGADGPDAAVNPTFVEIGGSPYEGKQRPLCDTKLVGLTNGKSIVPMFNVFTDVPLPGRFFALNNSDLQFSTDPKSLLYGEKAGIPFSPVGIYDWANRLITTVETDYNGLFDVLLPSTNRINCPTPSGVCGNLYRFVGNDPGVPGRLNLNYNPQYRTIAAEFETWPGIIVPADTAPTQVGVTVQLPGAQTNTAVSCSVNDPTPGATPTTPELYAVSKPYADLGVAGAKTFTIEGQGFGTPAGTVALDGIALPTTSWSDTHIGVSLPATTAIGPHQLSIRAASGKSAVNGLTFHVLGISPFPATGVLDNFNRTTGLGPNWTADPAFAIDAGNVRVTGTPGTMRWTPSVGAVFGADQEAFFTFVKVGPTAGEQGLFLKVTGSGTNPNPTATSSAYIEVSYKATTPTSVQVRTKATGTGTIRLKATFSGVTFAANDQLGARALADGTVVAYKNGTEIGRVNVTSGANPWPAALAAGGGRLGVRFVGAQNSTTNDARFDDFGGGTVFRYTPSILEVGPGRTYAPAETLPAAADHAIQRALDAAPAGALVVVYPNAPSADPRQNPRGAYYENLIISKPVKLQGVGPGSPNPGAAANAPDRGSIIDGGAFAGDSPVATDWYTKIGALTWDGNQTIYDGAVISLYTTDGAFPSTFSATTAPRIDGLDLRGGDQQGFPGNINVIGGGPTGQPGGLITQGGAIFANAYARNLQITNNVVQNNGGAFGTIRIGTPDLPAPDTDNQNDAVRIANNRIIANGGTNLAGGIGIFAGADGYAVAGNDICGNFSAEYGGGLSVYGRSPNGSIDHNRVYYNQSYDEGGGIMIAGQLPTDPSILSPGTGAVSIHENLVQANMANDDGGGIRFLMAGNFPMNVYNNMIVNNVSTHEGGGIAIDDAPNVRVYNNTIMKNITTATAVTSTGEAAPAGLSTGGNSALLQATLPANSPTFSNPLLFNNIFWDNRAGTRASTTVTGIGAADADHWDMGVPGTAFQLSPTDSILQSETTNHNDVVASGTNKVDQNPAVVLAYDTELAFAPWRTNPNFVGAILVTTNLPPNLTGNYHLLNNTSPAYNGGVPSKAVPTYQAPPASLAAPTTDIDGEARPGFVTFDIGADEIR